MSPSTEKLIVTGANGMLGRAVMARLGGRGVGADLPEFDITNRASMADLLDRERPDALLNCAAWTDVDGAETHRDEAAALNAEAVGLLAELCRDRGIHFVTISTDYVFTGVGTAPFGEDADPPAFGSESVYGMTKLAGERHLREAGGEWTIVRTQWLYGAGGKNFIDTIAKLAGERESLKVVDDQVGAPTWVEDLAGALVVILNRRATGVFHCVNSGYVSWRGVAQYVVERLQLPCRIEPCTSEAFPRPARRPKNSRLSQEKFASLAGAPLRDWREALDEYLNTKYR